MPCYLPAHVVTCMKETRKELKLEERGKKAYPTKKKKGKPKT